MKERPPFPSILFNFLSLFFMALLTIAPSAESKPHHSNRKRKNHPKQPSSWDQIKNLLTCKQIEGSKIHDPSRASAAIRGGGGPAASAKLGSCSSICSFRDVIHGNTRVVHRADNSPDSSTVEQEARLLGRKAAAGNGSSASSRTLSRSNGVGVVHTASSSSRGMQLRKLSGCYECHTSLDPSRFPSPRTRVCACSECGEVFPKMESLELHQAVRHAVSELGPEDSGRNIVEIIFKSSWLKKDSPICKIERILKVHNTQRTIQRFEDCRDAVKIRATSNTKKNPRCAADGNELLRFHCTTLSCSLGARGSSSLCAAVPGCGVCTIIRHGFQGKASSDGKGVRTTAGSGRAHDCLGCSDDRRAMIVCRVVAGRVRRLADDAAAAEEDCVVSPGLYDSVAGNAGIYSNLEELVVFNPKAILPCFVVIYKAVEY
ncbi:hypothetical protein RHMOL_Rhmol07G0311800 [Rhododendron molle]|uniref:Uncharacterized protein n=1 Tax=Rhododendron molle TaxID=49168 RepID=A0ACC0N7S3_RHOML|nr:hypothetical protein RHMOL_Rhmol07G0311800 [Rhododendron molle]